METDAEARRVYWHSRRGMRELDLVLMPFAEREYPLLDAGAQADYRRLLAQEDADIFGWIVHRSPVPDPSLRDIVERVMAYGRAGVADTP